MKKIVIFVIFCLYVVSIVIVGLLGAKMTVPDSNVYVATIDCSSVDGFVAYDETSNEFVNEGLTGKIVKSFSGTSLIVNVFAKLYSDEGKENTTIKTVTYSLNNNAGVRMEVQADGSVNVIFEKATSTILTIKSDDSRGKYIKIKVEATGKSW